MDQSTLKTLYSLYAENGQHLSSFTAEDARELYLMAGFEVDTDCKLINEWIKINKTPIGKGFEQGDTVYFVRNADNKPYDEDRLKSEATASLEKGAHSVRWRRDG